MKEDPSIRGRNSGRSSLLGLDAIPVRWREPLELVDVIEDVADDLFEYPTWNIGEHVTGGDNERIWARYSGW